MTSADKPILGDSSSRDAPLSLREQVAAIIQTRPLLSFEQFAAMPLDVQQQKFHELQVHQIELEIQNQHLSHTQLALQKITERFELAVAGTTDGLWDWDVLTDQVFYSARFKALLGYADDDSSFVENLDTFWQRIHPDDFTPTELAVANAIENNQPYKATYRLKTKAGDWCWFEARGGILRDSTGRATRMSGGITDITQRQKSDQDLHASLQEKLGLLNEVHHRVKNNLQVISSLLRLEAGRSAQAETKSMLLDMQGRIRSMSLLHESLYRSGIFASVDLGAYLTQLATQVFRLMNTHNGAIALQLDLDAIDVGIDQATSCGLLINELISNSLKHGFSASHGGEVRVELHRIDGDIQLCVSDTGVGLPDDFELARANTLGLQLVSDLVKQLNGTLAIQLSARFVINFSIVDQQKPMPSAQSFTQ